MSTTDASVPQQLWSAIFLLSTMICTSLIYLYLHLGHLSVQRAILRVREFRSKSKESVEAFIEEAVVRRELADNFCFYNPDKYDSIKGTNAWAQTTLQVHAQDKREYLYTKEQFENGQTHDDLWNAAQVWMTKLHDTVVKCVKWCPA